MLILAKQSFIFSDGGRPSSLEIQLRDFCHKYAWLPGFCLHLQQASHLPILPFIEGIQPSLPGQNRKAAAHNPPHPQKIRHFIHADRKQMLIVGDATATHSSRKDPAENDRRKKDPALLSATEISLSDLPSPGRHQQRLKLQRIHLHRKRRHKPITPGFRPDIALGSSLFSAGVGSCTPLPADCWRYPLLHLAVQLINERLVVMPSTP